MADKPKISHFAAAGSSTSGSRQTNGPDRSGLGQLYPQPKTYEQIKQDSKQRQVSYRKHWPKYPHVAIAAYGSVVFGLLIWFASGLNNSWFSSSNSGLTISSVFFSFAIWLVLAVFIIVWVHYVNAQFSYFGGSIRLFWILYIVIMAALIIVWQSGWMWDYTHSMWVPVLTALHMIMVFITTRRIMGQAS
jgi:hypothetical protein